MLRSKNKTFFNVTPAVPAAALVVSLLCALLVSPIFIATSKDVAFSNSPLPFLLQYVLLFMETAYFALLTAFVVCSAYFSKRDKKPAAMKWAFACAVVIILISFAANVVASIIFDGKMDLYDVAFSLITPVLDIVFLLVAMLIAARRSERHVAYADEIRRASRIVGNMDIDDRIQVFPFVSFISTKNVIQFPLFVSALILCASSVFQRILNDIAYGAPTNIPDLLEMIFAYCLDLIVAFVAYVMMYFISIFIFRKKIKAEEAK